MNTYEAIVTREGKWWMVSIPQIDGLTQARTLAEAPAMAAEYIAVTTEQDINDIAVEWIVDDVAGIHIPDAVAEIRSARNQAEALERYATARAAQLARELRDIGGLTVRDIGAILGVSYQRAQQLATTETAEAIRGDDFPTFVAFEPVHDGVTVLVGKSAEATSCVYIGDRDVTRTSL